MVQHLGCSPQGVTVIFDEFDKGNWFIGSKDANELFPNAKYGSRKATVCP